MKNKLARILVLACGFCAASLTLSATPIPDNCRIGGYALGCQAWTFNRFSVFEAIDKTAEAGGKVIEFYPGQKLSKEQPDIKFDHNASDDLIAKVKAKLAEKGIRAVNYGVVGIPKDEAGARKVFEFAKKWGIDTLVAEPEPEALDLVEKLCKEYNIKVAFHDHPKPSRYWNPDIVLAAIKGRTPLMGACADVGHWMRSGLDPLECLKKLDGHIICLHFKDLNEMGPKAHDVPWGTGVGKTKELMAELKRQNFHGAFCVEYEYHWENSSPEIAQCVKFWNDTCAELAASPSK